jgi:hypothetical protein
MLRPNAPDLDALLKLRPDITAVGKRLIASLILELEFHSPGMTSARFSAKRDGTDTDQFSAPAATWRA